MLTRKAKRCTFTKPNGDPCNGPRLTKQGIQKLFDQGISLVPDPESLCSFHARTETERRRMSSRGGSHSPKRVQQEQQERRRDVIEQETKLAAYTLIRKLVDATIENTFPVEPDIRKRAVGVYLAAHLCEQPEDRAVFAHSLQTRDLRNRHDIWEIAEQELRAGIDELEEADHSQAWKLVTLASSLRSSFRG